MIIQKHMTHDDDEFFKKLNKFDIYNLKIKNGK